MHKGDTAWIIENGHKIMEVEIISFSGNLILIKTQNGKTLRLPKHRLYTDEVKVLEDLKKIKFKNGYL